MALATVFVGKSRHAAEFLAAACQQLKCLRNINTDRIYQQQFYNRFIAVVRQIMSKNAYYAVAKGRKIGVFHTWNECKLQTDGFPGPKFKKFNTQEDALRFIEENKSSRGQNTGTTYIPLGIPTTSETKVQIVNWEEVNKLSGDVNKPEVDLPTLNSILRRGQFDVKLVAKDSHSNAETYKKPRKVNESKRQNAKTPSTTSNANCISVFTDGACEANGKSRARGGIGVYWGPDHRLNVSEPLRGRQTNNRAEIHAAIKAVRQAKTEGLKEINLHTDSQFLIHSITCWIHKWKRNNWKLSTGGPVKNKEDFEELDKVLNGITVHWIHVRGHAGIAGNEAADELARRGALKNDLLIDLC